MSSSSAATDGRRKPVTRGTRVPPRRVRAPCGVFLRLLCVVCVYVLHALLRVAGTRTVAQNPSTPDHALTGARRCCSFSQRDICLNRARAREKREQNRFYQAAARLLLASGLRAGTGPSSLRPGRPANRDRSTGRVIPIRAAMTRDAGSRSRLRYRGRRVATSAHRVPSSAEDSRTRYRPRCTHRQAG